MYVNKEMKVLLQYTMLETFAAAFSQSHEFTYTDGNKGRNLSSSLAKLGWDVQDIFEKFLKASQLLSVRP